MSGVTNLDVWKKHLEKNRAGENLPSLANISRVLRAAPEFKDKLGIDQFSHTLMVLG